MDDINVKPVTPVDDIDVKKLENCYFELEAELRSTYRVISNLELENKHLRQVIEMLITSKSPTL